jgi:hypothetical protein
MFIFVFAMNREKTPLYRRLNKLARGYLHISGGGDYCHQRNTKEMKTFEGAHKSIRRTREGYDYTPLFKFLLSAVGQDWDIVFSEAVKRLDKTEPIFWLVDMHFEQGSYGVVRLGENSYYSKLMVQNGILEFADTDAAVPEKSCTCCTHSFNGVAY